MSSTVQPAPSTSSTSNIQLITVALADYSKKTGIDLSKNPFAAAIDGVNSPGAILELLHEREKAFKDYQEGTQRSPSTTNVRAFLRMAPTHTTFRSHHQHAGLMPLPPQGLVVGARDR